jgi:hypothetical protein
MVINTFLHILLMNKLIHTYILVILYIVMTNSFSTYADYVHSYDINYLQRWTLVLLYMYFIRSQLDECIFSFYIYVCRHLHLCP